MIYLPRRILRKQIWYLIWELENKEITEGLLHRPHFEYARIVRRLFTQPVQSCTKYEFESICGQWRTGPSAPLKVLQKGPLLLKKGPFCKNVFASFRVSKQSTMTGQTLSPPWPVKNSEPVCHWLWVPVLTFALLFQDYFPSSATDHRHPIFWSGWQCTANICDHSSFHWQCQYLSKPANDAATGNIF